jgi:hypothetical protein
MKGILLWLLMASGAWGQTNPAIVTPDQGKSLASSPGQSEIQMQPGLSIVQRTEQMRAACIQGRRSICGRIVKVMPDGLVVESGYTNLLRTPLTRSWLVPGKVTASQAANLIESREPGAVGVGLVFLTDVPKSRRLQPKVSDYVIIEGYPAGQYDYVSVGTVRRTLRKFSAELEKAVALNLQAEDAEPPSAAEAK